jgi:prepilin-type N-terminal cleavage/methylation domain-containing protein
MNPRSARGFTLVELVVALTLAAIVAGFLGLFLTTPVESYFAQTRRSDLVDAEDRILRNVSMDVRNALPGSLRSTASATVVALELLSTSGIARYYGNGDKSYLTPPQRGIEELTTGSLDTDGFYTLTQYGPTTGSYLAVTYVGAPSAYALTGIMTPQFTITANAATSEDQITLNGGGFKFSGASPTHSSFIVSGPVTYLCDLNAKTLGRYWNYPVKASQAAVATAAKLTALGASTALIATHVTACTLTPYQPVGTNTGQLLILRITLTSSGELLQVFHQVSTRYGA